jgi:hypothetical protein
LNYVDSFISRFLKNIMPYCESLLAYRMHYSSRFKQINFQLHFQITYMIKIGRMTHPINFPSTFSQSRILPFSLSPVKMRW